MKITVFGANGKVGSLVVSEALRRGYQVTAFVHNKAIFGTHASLKTAQGDIYNVDQVALALEGSQVVISALGSWGTPKKDILASGMRHIIQTMKNNQIERIISLTGAGANAPDDKLSTMDKALHGLMDLCSHKILEDGEEHIRLLQNSQLNWTVIRSPIMNSAGSSKKYNLTNQRPLAFATVNRHSVAIAMVDLVGSDQFRQQSPFITR